MKKIVILFLFILGICLVPFKGFSLTAKPNQQRCEPPCCKEIAGSVIYFCFLSDFTCEFTCNIECPNPEGGGSMIYTCCRDEETRSYVCVLYQRIVGVNGCDYPTDAEARQEISNDADAVCYTGCYDYIWMGCSNWKSDVGACRAFPKFR